MISGKSWIGNRRSEDTSMSFYAFNPESGSELEGRFFAASDEEIEEAVQSATSAFEIYGKLPGSKKAEFLERIAHEILELGGQLIDRACAETGLPEGRITGERGRTVGQLRAFAQLLREGSWVNAIIETAQPEREPLPKPDLRSMLVPTGPTVVFTASNFPLAFSTAGGDTASALAAGNPVIVKAHESHPGTNELVSTAIINAAEATGMPHGVFSSLNGIGYELGTSLVKHPLIKSVAFTGSYKGGKALYDIAQRREDPIPVFAEMGSVNPVVLFPGKLAEAKEQLAEDLAGSITLGAGQFCTNPGLIIGIDGPDLENFSESLASAIAESTAQIMLNAGIQKNYSSRVEELGVDHRVEMMASGKAGDGPTRGVAAVASVDGSAFILDPKLHEEVFGPYSLVVKCADTKELDTVISTLEGQLTTTAMVNSSDVTNFSKTIEKMGAAAGRLIFNGVPTGVEVCHAMQHGGPFPSTTDPRFTSVGTEAIKRFVRPLCFQSAPQELLPEELRNDNKPGIWRKVNGEMTREAI